MKNYWIWSSSQGYNGFKLFWDQQLTLDYTIDDNHLKQNKYIPGTNIQIKSIDDIEPEIYDNVVVLAWNFFNEIKRKNSKIFKMQNFKIKINSSYYHQNYFHYMSTLNFFTFFI